MSRMPAAVRPDVAGALCISSSIMNIILRVKDCLDIPCLVLSAAARPTLG